MWKRFFIALDDLLGAEPGHLVKPQLFIYLFVCLFFFRTLLCMVQHNFMHIAIFPLEAISQLNCLQCYSSKINSEMSYCWDDLASSFQFSRTITACSNICCHLRELWNLFTRRKINHLRWKNVDSFQKQPSLHKNWFISLTEVKLISPEIFQ